MVEFLTGCAIGLISMWIGFRAKNSVNEARMREIADEAARKQAWTSHGEIVREAYTIFRAENAFLMEESERFLKTHDELLKELAKGFTAGTVSFLNAPFGSQETDGPNKTL